MTHKDIEQLFIKWFVVNPDYQGWVVFPNRTGYASKERVHYGVPPTGGGSDYIAFGPNGHTQFFEIKTESAPTLRKNQKNFNNNMINLGFKCWIVRECAKEKPGFYIVQAQDYRPNAKWPY